ncbi:MAG TPA: M14-type cytosolic carboxypeptidase [Tepidisphaeraceae bacterium]
MKNIMQIVGLAAVLLPLSAVTTLSAAEQQQPTSQGITFNLNFEGASLGRIERVDETTFRCHVLGQQDERGRNRQATWYDFRMDHVAGKDVTLTLTDFVGEYHDRPGASPAGPDIVPVFRNDGGTWRHFPATQWDPQKKEITLKFRPERDSIWIAHVPPYTPSDLQRLLADLHDRPVAVVETIGRTVQGRDIPMVTVTNPDVPDAGKKVVWLQARQHAWEAGTSYVMEGALRFITSDDPAARDLRDKVLFKFTPMVDLDGCASGQVRCNANGYDVNMHWRQVDLRHPEFLRLMPEIWYTKKAILSCMTNGHGIDLLVNMHNTETGEYLDTEVSDPQVLHLMRHFDALLARKTTFDPSNHLTTARLAPDDTNSLWGQQKVPVLLMEQRITTCPKLGHHPTVEDRLAFGRQLVAEIAEAVLTEAR